ncbi:hypothetical protein KCP74_20770 [Salmonella enterica subsp. enterica]|nr:hypothetical protein KCP74_20770 [Salmonella enterica subsp. enterica]
MDVHNRAKRQHPRRLRRPAHQQRTYRPVQHHRLQPQTAYRRVRSLRSVRNSQEPVADQQQKMWRLKWQAFPQSCCRTVRLLMFAMALPCGSEWSTGIKWAPRSRQITTRPTLLLHDGPRRRIKVT